MMSAELAVERLRIPGYTIKRKIGAGGMATVYLAVQDSLERPVALKVLDPRLASDKSFCDRFLKEGKIVAQLAHPRIVTIYDIGCHGDYYYMAMAYIGGGHLKQRIRLRRGMDNPLRILGEVAQALDYAHQHGFVHRDVKPANILFDGHGDAVLSDFGIAKVLSAQTQLTVAGFAVGTPEYMSPEQVLGKAVDGRSDLYSLGIVFYETLTGEKPYQGGDPFSTALMHVNNPVPRLPPALARHQSLISHLLAKDPKDRFQNAQELLGYLDRAALGKKVSRAAMRSERPRVGQQSASKSNRRRWMRYAAFAMMAIGPGAGYFFLNNPVQVPQPKLPDLSDPARHEQVEHLLSIAQAHEMVGRLTEPPGSNALEAYQIILQIDPHNEQAKQAVTHIEGQLAQQHP